MMKILKKSALVIAIACISANASASITKWMDGSSKSVTENTEMPKAQNQDVRAPQTTQHNPQVKPQQQAQNNNPNNVGTPANQYQGNKNVGTATNQNQGNRVASVQPQLNQEQSATVGGFTPSLAEQQTEKLVNQYMARTQGIATSSDIQALSAEDHLAVIMLNGALIQAGMDYLSNNQTATTQSLYNKAIGCINSRNSADLIQAAQAVIAKHTKITNVTKVINSGPKLSSGYKVACSY